jgi:hypothetical protein
MYVFYVKVRIIKYVSVRNVNSLRRTSYSNLEKDDFVFMTIVQLFRNNLNNYAISSVLYQVSVAIRFL